MHDSTSQGETALAVDGRDIYFYFDRRKRLSVLNGLNIAVSRGTIYSLLGPSGCGKTTILKCIVGQHKLQEGSLKIYGRDPGSKGFFIPGRGVGYMPQDLALYPEITTEETLRYFGSLCFMNKQDINQRITFLVDLLAIPDQRKQIKHLSGGQQRRVSFAAALIHKPPLLVLDEPTVGVDPLLRQAIWDHLITLARNEHLTIIITTHYIEEARQAHVVGLMRDGCLLAEKNPEHLIQMYGMVTLEHVFLRLCRNNQNQNEHHETNSGPLTSVGSLHPDYLSPNKTEWQRSGAENLYSDEKHVENSGQVFMLSAMSVTNNCDIALDERNDGQDNTTALLSLPPFPKEVVFSKDHSSLMDSWLRFCCLTRKNFLRLKRNIFVMIFQMFIPTIQIVIFCLCVGSEPFDLPVAVVNMEKHPNRFGNHFLHSINNRTISQVPFDNLSLAIESVKSGEYWAAIYIHPEFQICLIDRYLEGVDVTNDTIECSSIKLYLDMSNQQIVATIYSTLLRSFQNFSNQILEMVDKNPLLATPPLKVEEPIYGSVSTSFTEFMAPGMITGITYIMAIGLSSMAVILEKKQGLLDRTFVAGATAIEVLMALFFTMFVTMFVQALLVLACTFLIFEIPCNGPFVWVVICVMLVGIGGMVYGLFVSAICDDENFAVMVSLGSFYPNLLLSGVIWPVEGMPYYLRYFSYSLPLTLISNTMRSIITRGWNITENHIWDGCLVSIFWSILFLVLSVILFKIRK